MTEPTDHPGEDGARPRVPQLPRSIEVPKTQSSALRGHPSSAHSLAKFSLLNATHELEAMAQNQKPLLGSITLATQATVFYAKPNTGKTLITLALLREAVGIRRMEGSRCIYIAADDNPAGVLEKQKALKPYGVHVVA